MSKVAFIEGGKVANVALGDAAFAAAVGAVVCPDGVGKGWSYDGVDFTPPPAPPEPTTGPDRVHRYVFAATYLTATENDAWIALVDEAEQTAPASRTDQQKDILRAWRHFTLAEYIEREAPETQAAIYGLHLWGVLTQERADRVALFLAPA